MFLVTLRYLFLVYTQLEGMNCRIIMIVTSRHSHPTSGTSKVTNLTDFQKNWDGTVRKFSYFLSRTKVWCLRRPRRPLFPTSLVHRTQNRRKIDHCREKVSTDLFNSGERTLSGPEKNFVWLFT